MPQEWLSKQTLYAEVSRKKPVRRSRTGWLDYITNIARNRLELHPSEMQSPVCVGVVDRVIWRLNLELLPQQLYRKSG